MYSAELAERKQGRIDEGHLKADQAQMMISIPPKFAVLVQVGYIKGRGAVHLARVYGEHKRNFVGQHFRAGGTGFCVWLLHEIPVGTFVGVLVKNSE